MGKDILIKILQEQLDVANKTNIRLNATIKSMEAHFNATIADLRKTIENLETLLKERDESLNKANSQMRGLKATFLRKQSEKQIPIASPKTEAEINAEKQTSI